MTKSKVQVIINKVQYSLVTDESPQIVEKAASCVHEALEAITHAGVEEHYKAAVLAALQFSTALVKAEKKRFERESKERELLEKIQKEGILSV